MLSTSTFTVYNASAGSGKTYTLVKEYLKILLSTPDPFEFQHILAVTFTNKAAHEMKERVLNSLKQFALNEQNEMFYSIREELDLDELILRRRSQRAIHAILQNYTAFSITTIDSFVYKIIKSFAFDLGLSQNFEVEMDSEELLKESIDLLISKIGVDQELTHTLVHYARDKSNEDKSWDISKDLFESSKMLLKEDDIKRLKKIENKTLEDFEVFRKKLNAENSRITNDIERLGKKGIERIETLGLKPSNFYKSYFPNLLEKFTLFKNDKEKKLSFSKSLNDIFEGSKLPYAQSLSSDKKNLIDSSFTFFQEVYYSAKGEYEKFRFNRLLLRNVIPVATIKLIYEELQEVKEQNNIQLNAEFDHILSNSIQDQPAPFIYERIGQKFRHYFIDEMQDTSEMQWNNFLPLLHNALAQEGTSLMLVGDGKQSIYRWRGGKAEQFIDLGNESKSQFILPIEKKVKTLRTNYRSYSEVIHFNNRFFSFTSNYLQNSEYRELFEQTASQETAPSKEGGYVSLHFVAKDPDEKKNLNYALRVLDIIDLVQGEFHLGEICIIVRKREEGVTIAEVLTEKGIPIVSSETLLLKNSKEVSFLINLLEYSFQPTDENKFQILYFLYHHLSLDVNIHEFLSQSFDQKAFFSQFGLEFNLEIFSQLSLYEKTEYAISVFKLAEDSDAYIQFFLDEVLKWQQKEMSIQEVLEYWSLKKDKLSIVSPKEGNAVQIMTIHKSKGLEFPVVIYAGDVDVYYDRNHLWLSKPYDNFDDFILPKNKELSTLNSHTESLYHERQQQLELDAINLLYVTLTRAQEQLYVVTDDSKNSKKDNLKYFSQYFKAFLEKEGLYTEQQSIYNFGDAKRKSKTEIKRTGHKYQKNLPSNFRSDHNIEILSNASKLWGTQQKKAQEYGQQFHEVLSKIQLPEDVDLVLNREFQKGSFSKAQLHSLRKIILEIVSHPRLKKYFSQNVESFNERVLIDTNGQLLIPDKLIFSKDEVVILDYKTGEPNDEHRQQLFRYERVLKSMGFTQIKKVLVYVSDSIQILEF